MSMFDQLKKLLGLERSNGAKEAPQRSPVEPGGRVAGPPEGAGCSADADASITCEEAIRVVQEFLDGELDGVRAAHVKAHFDVCGRCYPHLNFETAYREAICRAVRGETAPEELKSKLSALIAEVDSTD